MSPLSGWTVHLVREDGLQSHTLRIRRGRLLSGFAIAAVSLLGLGVVGGRYWTARDESAAVAALDRELAEVRGEAAQVTRLAERLAQMETRYERLRAAVTAGEPSEGGVTIPFESPGVIARSDAASTAAAWPLTQSGFVTRTFGSRAASSPGGHTGVDIAVPSGSYVRAIRAGRVTEVGEDSVYGKFVRIAHVGGLASLYGHNSWLFASAGDSVERLQVIALSGNTGRSTAPHLHLEIRQDGQLLDPLAHVAGEVGRNGSVSGRNRVEQR